MCLKIINLKKKQKKRKQKKIKKNKIQPYIHHKDSQSITTEEFLKECIACHNCKQIFNLGSNELKIHCAGCDKFFHCGIAGQCRGEKCNETTMGGTIHKQSWCIHCVPPMKGNEEKPNGEGTCLCYDCLN